MSKEKRLVILNDVHAGSKFAAVPERWKLRDYGYAPSTEANQWIYERYEGWVEEFKKPDILILAGDMVDGHAHINYGTEVWGDGYEQYKLACYLVSKLEAKEIYVIFGSKYHVQLMGTPVEQFMAQALKAKGMGWRLRRELGGSIVSVAHHIGVSMTTWQYRTTALARELVLDRLQNEDKTANLLVRGHAHYFVYAGFSHQLGIINPGFQGQTPFGAMKCPEIIPKIGLLRVGFNLILR